MEDTTSIKNEEPKDASCLPNSPRCHEGEDASEKLLATRTLEYIMGTREEAPGSCHDGVILPTTDGKTSPQHPGLNDISSLPNPVLLAEIAVEIDAAPDPSLTPVPPLVLSFDEGEESDTESVTSTPVKQGDKKATSAQNELSVKASGGAEEKDFGIKTLEQIRMEKIHKESDSFYGAAYASTPLDAPRLIEQHYPPKAEFLTLPKDASLEKSSPAPIIEPKLSGVDEETDLRDRLLNRRNTPSNKGVVSTILKPLVTVCSQIEPDVHSVRDSPTLVNERRNEETETTTLLEVNPVVLNVVDDSIGTETVTREFSTSLCRPRIQENLMKVLNAHSDKEKETIANICQVPVELLTDSSLQTHEVSEISLDLKELLPATSNFKHDSVKRKNYNDLVLIFEEVNRKQASKWKIKFYSKKLVQLLTNTEIVPNMPSIIFIFLRNLLNTTENFLLSPGKETENCIFIRPSESCIVESLLTMDKELYSKKLLKNFLIAIHHLLMAQKKPPDALAALMRVYVELCKSICNPLKVIELCLSLLKRKHRCGPYLIASSIKIWTNVFSGASDLSEEYVLSLDTIAFGCKEKPAKLDMKRWNWSKSIIDLYFKTSSVPQLPIIFEMFRNLVSSCSDETYSKVELILCCLVSLASREPWAYIEKHVIKSYVIPALEKYSRIEVNKKAFELVCDLCVHLHLLNTNMPLSYLMQYFNIKDNQETYVIRKTAGQALVKFMIMRRMPIEGSLSLWIQKSLTEMTDGTFGELFQYRNLYYAKGLKSIDDIVIL